MKALAALALAACGGSPSLGDGGPDASIATQQCSAGFSGAVVAIDLQCAVTVAYASATQTWTLSTNGNVVPSTNDTWTGVRVTFDGAPAPGTYDGSMAVGVAAQLSDLSVIATPQWILTPSSGSLHATITALGPFDDLGGGNRLYAAPRGEIDVTLVDDSDLGASSVGLKVTF